MYLAKILNLMIAIDQNCRLHTKTQSWDVIVLNIDSIILVFLVLIIV